MSQRYTSRVFEAHRKLYDALNVEDTFPPHVVTGDRPVVLLGDDYPDAGQERIVVDTVVLENDNEWARLSPAGRDEVLTYEVVGRSLVPGTENTSVVVSERLEALADIVQGVVFDIDTNRTKTLGFLGEVAIGRAASVTYSMFTMGEGYGGMFTVRFRLLAQI
jgi:hypothetical protein